MDAILVAKKKNQLQEPRNARFICIAKMKKFAALLCMVIFIIASMPCCYSSEEVDVQNFAAAHVNFEGIQQSLSDVKGLLEDNMKNIIERNLKLGALSEISTDLLEKARNFEKTSRAMASPLSLTEFFPVLGSLLLFSSLYYYQFFSYLVAIGVGLSCVAFNIDFLRSWLL